MIDELYRMCENNDYVSIYTNTEDLSCFKFGKILCCNDNHVLFYMVSRNGIYDGMLLMSRNDIIRLEINDKYSNRMKILCELSGGIHFDYKFSNDNIIQSVLEFAQVNNKIISVELLNSGNNDVVGFVDVFDENKCKIKQVDNYGYDDGWSYVCTKDITEISVDSLDEQILFKLWENKSV